VSVDYTEAVYQFESRNCDEKVSGLIFREVQGSGNARPKVGVSRKQARKKEDETCKYDHGNQRQTDLLARHSVHLSIAMTGCSQF